MPKFQTSELQQKKCSPSGTAGRLSSSAKTFTYSGTIIPRVYGPLGPPTTADDASLLTFPQSLNALFASVWNDLQHFSAMCNTSYRMGHRLHANTFNEMVASILYRLLGLSFDNDTSSSALNEAVRIGMIVFASTVSFRGQMYDRDLLDRFRAALFQLWHTTISASWPSSSQFRGTGLPPASPTMLLWLLTMWKASGCTEGVRQGWAFLGSTRR
ncbi:hypothetical protein C8A01DRAFT_37516 [Parachaetomium inaequale]|uniref:Uncharacterized protein n=1 Tax=Parachaetomium inaequale TaxID=2588326 RepID=A0AAN6PG00_9PEZI|nr:hypothetical protein C8A01DRAFT_37516 [Parachaetomium inaequale]